MNFSRNKIIKLIVSKCLFSCLLLCLLTNFTFGQQTQKVNKEFANGNYLNSVTLFIVEGDQKTLLSEVETINFYNAFFIKPGTTFNPLLTDLAVNRIKAEKNVKDAYYELFESETGTGTISRPLAIVVYIELQNLDKQESSKKGLLTSNGSKDFPIIYASGQSEFKFFANGGLGLYNDENALFGEGLDFTQGNPVANKPAEKGTRFWSEMYLEPGISGISKLGNSNIYAYGEFSGVASGRNTTDIYSSGSAAYFAIERMYAGFLITGLGKKKDITINASYGRNFFQLNDGFLFAKTSGSSNAGERGSVYSSSRTAFQKNGSIALQWDKFRFSANFVEPQELFKNKQVNTNYFIGTFNYNNNKNLDAGISYIETTGGKGKYSIPSGSIAKKGMYIINPKLWLTDIATTGLFFKSEIALQNHHNEKMSSNAWYAGLGYSMKNIKTTPSVYYRYAFLKGDDANSETYERFDPILTGGLGNWVQGLNFRKVVGNGNIISHRVELTSWITRSMALSFDYFYLQANQLNNLGSLAPITTLKNKELGHEATLTLKGLLKEHFTLLGVISYGIPGKGLEQNFIDPLPNWLTVQAALFVNF